MKKMTLNIILSFLICPIYANPIIENQTFYTEQGMRAINLARLVTGGTPPYRFQYLVQNQNPPFVNNSGTLRITPVNDAWEGMVSVELLHGHNLGSLHFRVKDINGNISEIGQAILRRGIPKG